MSTVVQSTEQAAKAEGIFTRIGRLLGLVQDENVAPRVPWALAVVGISLAVLVLSAYRWYQQVYSFSVGLDYFEAEFQTYWMSLFWTQVVLLSLILAIGVPILWFTRPANPEAMTPSAELKIYYIILSFAAVGSIILVAGLGIYVEADAAWHQVTIRDTDFTPTHIGLFYFVIPAGAVGGILGFLWIHTRVPYFVNRVSIPLALILSAPVLIMPNLGLNEWGHTFFYAEELFAAPIHWGFVVLGWALFAIGGFIMQILMRVRDLTAIESDQERIAA
ncbi:MAG: methane monooxygenase/ammonia monooxygenase subunit C [Pseudomonadota bacterium]|nr:methane monooxygenase/ammonia monooxygenase subunit C [Pseudomonadota bacterium]